MKHSQRKDLSEWQQLNYMVLEEKEKDKVPQDNSLRQLSSIGLLIHPN
jgi:hypothetical protein